MKVNWKDAHGAVGIQRLCWRRECLIKSPVEKAAFGRSEEFGVIKVGARGWR